MRRTWRIGSLAFVALAACGGDSSIEPDPAVAPFVGTWDATEYTLTPEANGQVVIDVLGEFGAFHISIEPTGLYTAALEATGVSPEIGQLTVIGSTIRLDPTTPADAPTATANFVFSGADRLTLEGPTEININGVPGHFDSHIDLSRR